jgi:sodium transport system ATP-binding protein
VISIEHVSKAFGKRRILTNISFEAPAGAITGLLGPNGAGKTTLLRLLCGLLRPDAGTISLAGYDLALQPWARRQLGVLTEAGGLYTRLSVRENLRFVGQLHGLRGATLRTRIDELLALLGLEGLADVRTEGFSRGEQTRVGLARALIHRPRLLLLDEPTSTLDVASARVVRQVVRQLRDQGASIVLASHVMSEVEQLCDGLVLLSGGRVVATGTVRELCTATGQTNLEDAFVTAISQPDLCPAPVSPSSRGAREVPGDVEPRLGPCERRLGVLKTSLREASVVFRKELVDYWRDRAAQLSRLLMVLTGALVILYPLASVPQQMAQGLFEPLRMGVQGAEYAPALMAALDEHQVLVEPAPADPVAAVRGGTSDVVLIVPPEYEDTLASGRPVELRLLASTDRASSDRARQYVVGALARYQARVVRERLLLRGVDSSLTTPFQVALEDIAEPVGPGSAERGIVELALLMSMILVGLAGGSVATTATAGERERHTLEPLFQTTVRRLGLVLGKSGAAVTFGLMAGSPAVLALGVAAALPYASLVGVPSAAAVVSGVLALVLVAMLMVALQMLVIVAFPSSADATGSRMLLVTLPFTGLAGLAVFNAPYELVPHAIPVFGAVVLLAELLLGALPSPLALAVTLVGSLATIVLLLGLVTRLFEREAILRA